MPEIDQPERSPSPSIDRNMKSAMLTALIGYLGGCLLFATAVMRNPSSTAPIGVLFVPLEMIKFVIPLLVFGYGLPDLMQAIRLIREKKPAKWKFSAVISLGLALCGMGVLGYGMGLTYAVA